MQDLTCTIFSWAELKDFCRKYGEVTYTDAHFRSGEGRGEVCFAEREDMEKGKDSKLTFKLALNLIQSVCIDLATGQGY